MIYYIFKAIFDAVEYFALMFPDMPGFFHMQSLTTLIDLLYKSSFFVPYSTLFICLGIGFSFYSMKFTISVANWVIKKIPTIN